MKRSKKQLVRPLLMIVAGLLLVWFGISPKDSVPILEDTLGPAEPGYYRVVRVEDGDTITVRADGREERVRFIGIDTPETSDPRKPLQCFGKAATDFTANLIGDNDVRLETDALSGNRDRYDRLLRYVHLPDGTLVNAEIIKQGYGFAYTSFPFTKIEEFTDLQREARQENRGLWNECDPAENEYGGYTSNPTTD